MFFWIINGIYGRADKLWKRALFRTLDELFDSVWNIFDEPFVVVRFGSSQHASSVGMFNVRCIRVRVTVNIGKATTCTVLFTIFIYFIIL